MISSLKNAIEGKSIDQVVEMLSDSDVLKAIVAKMAVIICTSEELEDDIVTVTNLIDGNQINVSKKDIEEAESINPSEDDIEETKNLIENHEASKVIDNKTAAMTKAIDGENKAPVRAHELAKALGIAYGHLKEVAETSGIEIKIPTKVLTSEEIKKISDAVTGVS